MTAGKVWACYAVLTALALSPLLWAGVPPLVDYPNHLARAWILADAGRTPALAANYVVGWRLVPYLAMDAFVVGASALMPVELAGRIFVALAMLAPAAGTVALHRVLHGRWGLWPLAALLGVYNYMLFFGFVVCLLTMGLAMLAFAGWIAARCWPVWRRVVVFAPVGVLLLLGHLFGLGLYGLLVGSYELGEVLARRRRFWPAMARAAALGLQFVPALALWAATLSPTAAGSLTIYGAWTGKLMAALTPAMFADRPSVLDAATWLFAALVLYAGFTRRRLRLAAPMRWPLLAVAVAALAMPHWLSGSWAADMRLPVVLPLLLVAASQPGGVSRRMVGTVAAVAAVLLALRVGAVSLAFADYDHWYREFRAADAAIPVGARLLVVQPPDTAPTPPLPGLPDALGRANTLAFRQMPALAVIDRSAFLPYLFAGWFTIRIAPRNLPMWQSVGRPITPAELWQVVTPGAPPPADDVATAVGEAPYWRHWPADFDTVFWLSYTPGSEPVPANLRPVAHGSFFTMYRIER